jgi:phospholipid-binding lipoprotein MlaA
VTPRAALRTPAALAAALLLSACATTGPATPGDPWEGFNRKVFAFNEAVDDAVLRPVAEAYRDNVPQIVRTGVSNVLGNVGDLWSAANHFLQGKVQSGFEQGMRFLTNTLFGLGGLLDPASEMGLKRHSEDFGQTLGRWGMGPGPYLVLPLLGPSSVRDGIGRVPDMAASPSNLFDDSRANGVTTVLTVVDARAALLGVTGLADRVSLDKYSFFRQAYLARRQDAVYDGAPPAEAFEDIGDDPPPAAAAPASQPRPATPPSPP